MPSLNQLLSLHQRLLILDASSSTIQVGLCCAGERARWRSLQAEAGVGVFQGVDEVLAEAGLRMDEVGAFAFSEGPGSVLGIRTAAVAIRVWQALRARPAYRYQGLVLLAHHVVRARATTLPVTLIADARRETWHRVLVDASGTVGPMERVPTAAIGESPLMPEGFRQWSALPAPAKPVPYAVGEMLDILADKDVFEPTDQPDAHLYEEPSFKTWTPQVHRAP